MLEAALKNLFDYQRFERNAPLQDVIDEVLGKYARVVPMALSDEALAFAAGGTRELKTDSREPENDGRGKV